METFYVFSQSKTKLEAIICVLPQGGHLTRNNYVVVAPQSRLPIPDCASIYTVFFLLEL